MTRNLIPNPTKLPGLDVQGKIVETYARLITQLTAFMTSVVGFLATEHPRGPAPLGPVAIGATARKFCVAVTWRNEATRSTVDAYAIYRADAGTGGAPTTPTFSSAILVGVVPSGRIPRNRVTDDHYSWLDSDFSAADSTNGRRFAYWVKAIDNEFRQSPPVAIGSYTTVP